jgi:mRNA-degrading endonuclease toxin of MazEF toxin-antitoxin module
VVRRGQIWTLLRGGGQYRVLIISNDEYNGVEELAIWALVVARDVPQANQLAVRLTDEDPLGGAFVKIHGVVQIPDRTALRDNLGFVSRGTMSEIENALREFLELP